MSGPSATIVRRSVRSRLSAPIEGRSHWYRAALRATLPILAAALPWPSTARAATDNWQINNPGFPIIPSGSGNWSDLSHWSSGVLPQSGDTVNLALSGSNTIDTVTFDISGIGIGFQSVTVDMSTTSPFSHGMTLSISAGNFVASTEFVGSSVNGGSHGNGTVNFSGGTSGIGALGMGENATDIGNYNLSGSASLTTTSEYIGVTGRGVFNQSGGTNSPLDLSLANDAASTSLGTYNLSAGTLSANTEEIGSAGNGNFSHTGGTNTVNSAYLGYTLGATGNYTLGTGAILNAEIEYVGYGGTGTFTQNDGTNSPSALLSVGRLAGSNGTYFLSGGALIPFSNDDIGDAGTGTFIQTGGTNSGPITLGVQNGSNGYYSLSAGSLFGELQTIGDAGTGTFVQTGGTNSMGQQGHLQVGYGGSGTYSLGGTGTLIAAPIYIGEAAAGTFIQSDNSTLTAPYIILGFQAGSNGNSYTLSGGTLTVGGVGEFIGQGGSGTFTQTGGTNNAPSAYVGTDANGSGIYSLSGTGSLIVSTDLVVGDAGAGTFSQSGGTTTVGTPSVHAEMDLAFTNGSTGIFNLSATGSVVVNGDLNVGGGTNPAGGSAPQAGGAATLNIIGGSMTVTGTTRIWNSAGTTLSISGSGYLDLAQGQLIFDSSTANLAADYTTLTNDLVGGQIRSSFASATMGLALVRASDYLAVHPGGMFGGQSISSTDLLIQYTDIGDATLDGKISIADYAQIDAAFLLHVANPTWFNGDFNYDGVVNYKDYALIDFAYQQQSGPLADGEVAAHAAEFGAPYMAALEGLDSAVPEPGSLLLLALGGTALLRCNGRRIRRFA